jgi:hypothetical protein
MVRSQVEPNDLLPLHLRLFHSSQERDAGFGDSHMAFGFYPPPGMVNLAFPGENIDNMQYKARKYFATRPPGRVIVQADAHMFAHYRISPTRAYNESFDKSPDKQSALMPRVLGLYHRPKLLAYWNVWLRKGTFESRLKLSSNGWTESNEHWAEVDPETRKTLVRERATLHEPAEDFSQSAFAGAYRHLIEDLVARGARVCMVEFPVTAEYRQEIFGGTYQAAREWFAAQARQLGVRYMAHAQGYARRPELFGDMDHLNAQGAREFSRLIDGECFD